MKLAHHDGILIVGLLSIIMGVFNLLTGADKFIAGMLVGGGLGLLPMWSYFQFTVKKEAKK